MRSTRHGGPTRFSAAEVDEYEPPERLSIPRVPASALELLPSFTFFPGGDRTSAALTRRCPAEPPRGPRVSGG